MPDIPGIPDMARTPRSPRSPGSPEAREKITPLRRSPVRVILAVICATLILAYLASAVWNLLRLRP